MVKTIDIIMFLSNNMDKIIKEGLVITDVTEDQWAHPHYHARDVFSLYYDEKKEQLMSVLSKSGSPSCWNHYEMPVISYKDLAEEILERIEEAKEYEADDKNFVEYLDLKTITEV